MTEHHVGHNEVREGGVVHVCSCGWESRPCFSSAVASNEGADHRELKSRLSELKRREALRDFYARNPRDTPSGSD
jgi:hypothetical protein